jgi:hypothetical protein
MGRESVASSSVWMVPLKCICAFAALYTSVVVAPVARLRAGVCGIAKCFLPHTLSLSAATASRDECHKRQPKVTHWSSRLVRLIQPRYTGQIK